MEIKLGTLRGTLLSIAKVSNCDQKCNSYLDDLPIYLSLSSYRMSKSMSTYDSLSSALIVERSTSL